MLRSATLREFERADVAANSLRASILSFHFNAYEKDFYKFVLVVLKIFANRC